MRAPHHRDDVRNLESTAIRGEAKKEASAAESATLAPKSDAA